MGGVVRAINISGQFDWNLVMAGRAPPIKIRPAPEENEAFQVCVPLIAPVLDLRCLAKMRHRQPNV